MRYISVIVKVEKIVLGIENNNKNNNNNNNNVNNNNKFKGCI